MGRSSMSSSLFCALFLTAVACAAPVVRTRDDAAPGVVLASFDGTKSTTFKWTALNDPVMGGQSVSSVKVENGEMVFNGTCAVVPKLKAPGFAKASTSNGFFPQKPLQRCECLHQRFTSAPCALF